jgi:arylsulfatase A-like enzyme
MKNRIFCILAPLVVSACNSHQPKQESQTETNRSKPNIIIIVADDLGYSDIGPFGGEIHTPVLDKLSQQSMLFSNFHVLPTCSPSRSVLLTGYDNHVAGLGIMGEVTYAALKGQEGYSGHLSDKVATLPEILRNNGYHTYMAGKWHLGDEDGQIPADRGFEESFVLLQGGGSHYADQKPLSPPQVMDYRVNRKKLTTLPSDFYSARNYTDTLINYIDRNKADQKPFFIYASYTTPHDPLQAPKEYIDKYKGKYNMGWDSLRLKRLNSLKSLGIVPVGVKDFAPSGIPKWETIKARQKAEYARDMEVYAAMVDYLDMSIGRIFDYLKQQGLYDNTLILFMSDNGANGVMATTYPGNADGKYLGSFDNSLENRGLPNSFIEMGPGWAQASSSPFRLFKSFTSEGGIKAPLIIKMPAGGGNQGQWNKSFVHVSDIMPTILAIAGAADFREGNGNSAKQPIGKSILPELKGESISVHSDEGMGWELFERKAFIKGNWKILRLAKPFGSGEWQLFNLDTDPGESDDLSQQFPAKRDSLINNWMQYAKENDVIDHHGYYDSLFVKSLSADH